MTVVQRAGRMSFLVPAVFVAAAALSSCGTREAPDAAAPASPAASATVSASPEPSVESEPSGPPRIQLDCSGVTGSADHVEGAVETRTPMEQAVEWGEFRFPDLDIEPVVAHVDDVTTVITFTNERGRMVGVLNFHHTDGGWLRDTEQLCSDPT